MNIINICKHIGCRFYSASQHGCSKFHSAKSCPVSLIQRIEGTAYRLSLPAGQESSLQEAIVSAAKACCPDALVRLDALGDWPVESLARTQIQDLLGDTSHAQDLEQAIANLRIGPVPD